MSIIPSADEMAALVRDAERWRALKSPSVQIRTAVAVAIVRADNEPCPADYAPELEHDEISDWGALLADRAIAAITA